MKALNTVMLLAALTLSCGAHAQSADPIAHLRGATPIPEEGEPPRMMPQSNADLRQVRNYPEQPPVIPHQIEDYRIDLRSNKCLSCHARSRTGESQAPMVSVTHFMDAEGQFLASVTPRRYFCTQCHVPQHEVGEAIQNTFVDIDSLISTENKSK